MSFASHSLALCIWAPGLFTGRGLPQLLRIFLTVTRTAFSLQGTQSCNISRSILWYSAKFYFTFSPFLFHLCWPACSGFSLSDQKSREFSILKPDFFFRHPRASFTFILQMQSTRLFIFWSLWAQNHLPCQLFCSYPDRHVPSCSFSVQFTHLNEQAISAIFIFSSFPLKETILFSSPRAHQTLTTPTQPKTPQLRNSEDKT